MINMDKIIDEYAVLAENNCKRVDIFLSERLSKTRSFCQKLIELKLVKINGKLIEKSSVKVSAGDLINVLIPEEEKPNLEPKEIDFEIVYEHDEYIVINKPANVVVHPAPGNFDNTLVNGLLYKFTFEVEEGDFRPGIVHRLDKDTSGLMVITKNYKAKEKFASLFKNRDIEKKYKCVSLGKPKENFYKIENNIGRHKVNRKKMCVCEDGKYAKTEVLILDRFKNEFLADIKIYTGRTHQIRVHMAYLGFPIIGDDFYGDKNSLNYPIKRQALHSYLLKFNCPFDNKIREFEIDLPDDMAKLINHLKQKI